MVALTRMSSYILFYSTAFAIKTKQLFVATDATNNMHLISFFIVQADALKTLSTHNFLKT